MENNISKTTNKKGKWSIIIGFIIMFFVFIGTAISGIFAGLKGQLGSQFYDTYNVRYEFDPYSKSNDPRDGELNTDPETLYKETIADMNSIANSYSYMLLDQGITSTNVYPEVYIDSKNIVHAYLNANIDISKVKSSDPKISEDKDKKQDLAPSLAFYNNMNAADFSIVYCDGYKVTTHKDPEANSDTYTSDFKNAKLYMWNINGDVHSDRDINRNGLTDKNSKIFIDSAKHNQIDVHLANNDYTFGKGNSKDGYDAGSIKDTFHKYAEPKKTNDDEENTYPFMIIFHNLQGLINEMEYYVYLYYEYNKGQSIENSSIINTAWWQLDKNTQKFAEDVIKKYSQFLIGPDDVRFSKFAFTNDEYGFQSNPYNKLIPGSWDKQSHDNNIFAGENNYIDSKFLGLLQDADDEGNPILGKNSSVQYSFMNKYILGVVTKDNYTDYLPDKMPTKNTLDSDGKWMSISVSNSYFTTKQICDQMSSHAFPMKLMSVSYPYTNDPSQDPGDQWLKNINNTGLNKGNNSNVTLMDNTIHDSPIGIKNGVVTSFIALGLVILIIGIVVSILYRIPGVVLWVCSMLPVSLIFLILFLSNFGLSMSMILAGMLTFIASTIASINILNKIKKAYFNHRTCDQAILFSYSTQLFKTLDIFVVGLLLGIAIILFPTGSMLSFGICLIIGMILAFISTYFISWLINLLLFKNGIGMYKYSWLSSVKLKDNLSFDPRYTNKLETKISKFNSSHFSDQTYISRLKMVNTIAYKNWFNILIWSIVILISVVGITLLFTIGVPYSYTFYGGTRIMVLNNGSLTIDQVMALLPDSSSWFNAVNNGINNYIVIESSKNFDYKTINDALQTLNTTIFTQSINTKLSIESTYDVLYSILVFSALIAIYSLARYNWISVLPNFLVGSMIIILTISLTVIFQIRFDTNIFYAIYFVAILGYLMIFNFLGAINTTWTRSNFMTFSDLSLVYQYSISGYNENQLIIYSILLGMIFINMLFLPYIFLSVSIITLIGIIVSFILVNFMWPRFIEALNNRKNIYKIRIKNIHLGIEKRNYDKIDEELINGININAKKVQ